MSVDLDDYTCCTDGNIITKTRDYKSEFVSVNFSSFWSYCFSCPLLSILTVIELLSRQDPMELSAKRGFMLQPYWARIFKASGMKNKNEIVEAMQAEIKTIDKKSVYTDLLPSIESANTLQNFTDNFAAIIGSKLLNFIDYSDS